MPAFAADSFAENSFNPDWSQIGPASAWMNHAGESMGVPPEALARLDICLNEALANALGHGGTGVATSPIRLRISVAFDHHAIASATLTVCDSGVQFDPTTFTPRALPKSLDEAQPGGLGIILIRGSANELAYRYTGGTNQLDVTVFWPK